jgi:K+-sensing histidine kinase KdpD
VKIKSWLWGWGVLTIVAVLILGVLDWSTGYEYNFFVFYFLPVSVAAWFFGLVGSVALSIISALVWFGADILTWHIYPSSAYAVWNTMIRLVSFLAIGWSVARVKQLLNRERETAEVLRKSLSQIKVLETFLPICAQCKKIRNQEGMWQHLEVYIEQHSNTQFSHGYCPECARRAMAEAGLIDEKTEQAGKHAG